MVKNREGFRGVTTHVPELLWRKVEAEAEQRGVSATRVLTDVLRKHYRVAEGELPKPRKAGRKPKGSKP